MTQQIKDGTPLATTDNAAQASFRTNIIATYSSAFTTATIVSRLSADVFSGIRHARDALMVVMNITKRRLLIQPEAATPLLSVKNGINFDADENGPVYVVIILSALSGEDHIKMLTALAELFSNDSRLQQLLSANTLPAIQAVINA